MAENVQGSIIGPGIAKLNASKLSENFKIVNVEEMLWRVRMSHFPDEVQQIIKQ